VLYSAGFIYSSSGKAGILPGDLTDSWTTFFLSSNQLKKCRLPIKDMHQTYDYNKSRAEKQEVIDRILGENIKIGL
jgi:hypothetical protein